MLKKSDSTQANVLQVLPTISYMIGTELFPGLINFKGLVAFVFLREMASYQQNFKEFYRQSLTL